MSALPLNCVAINFNISVKLKLTYQVDPVAQAAAKRR